MKSDINNDLSKLNEWAKLWLVDFNLKKNKALVISTSAVPHLNCKKNINIWDSLLHQMEIGQIILITL